MPKFPELPGSYFTSTQGNKSYSEDQVRGYATDYLNIAIKEWLTSSFQTRVGSWMEETFGQRIASDRKERNHRFLEEALELVQSLDCTKEEAHQLVEYTFNRPLGQVSQEIGGVMVTLAALCNASASALDLETSAEIELAKNWTRVEQIRAKQASKPKFGPLPQEVKGEIVTTVVGSVGVDVSALAEKNYQNYFHQCAADCGVDVWIKAFAQGYYAALKKKPAEAPKAIHPDDLAIEDFASAMSKEMAQKRVEGKAGWESPVFCPLDSLKSLLHQSVLTGKWVAAGNYAMMVHHRTKWVAEAEEALKASKKTQLEDLMKFYAAKDTEDLILQQADHVAKLQAKTPTLGFSTLKPRVG